MSIRELQSRVLTRMLRLNAAEPASSLGTAVDPLRSGGWKVLIYDQFCSDVLSPLLTVSELRRLGITLHLPITARRDAVRDTPAIYFIQPTEANVELVLRDLHAQLYSSFHLHFSTSIPRPLLELLASRSAEQGTSGRIARVYDEYVHFVALEDALITLNQPRSFQTINDSRQSDAAMSAFVDQIVEALFCVAVSLGSVPVVRAQPDGAAALVASRLDERLRAHLIQRQNLFSSGAAIAGAAFHRPLLVLLDRSFDLTAPLHHTWTYQALLNDLLGLAANRVSIAEEPTAAAGAAPSSKLRVRSYDLSASEDKFWRTNAGQPFPAVASAVQDKLSALQEEQARITQTTSSSSFEDPNSATSDLSSAISALPRLQRRKRVVETHTNIATALLKAIKARDVDSFFELESAWISKASGERADLDRVIAQGKGTWRDRVRAALIFLLATDVNDAEIAQVRAALEKSLAEHKERLAGDGAGDLAALDFLTAFRLLHRLQAAHGSAAPAAAPAQRKGEESEGWGLFGKLANSVAKEVVSQTAGVLAGVRNLLPSNSDLPVTRLLDALLTGRESAEADRFLYFDPKLPKAKAAAPGRGRVNGGYKDAVVFVLGGGCYAEYQNVQDYAKRNAAAAALTSVVYGCTELCAPEQFLEQLSALGEQQKAAKKGQLPLD